MSLIRVLHVHNNLSKRVCVIENLANRVVSKFKTPPKLRPRLSKESKAAVIAFSSEVCWQAPGRKDCIVTKHSCLFW